VKDFPNDEDTRISHEAIYQALFMAVSEQIFGLSRLC